MLDIKLIRENPQIVRKDLLKRDMPDLIKKLDKLIEIDKRWRIAKQDAEKLKQQRNILGGCKFGHHLLIGTMCLIL